MNAVEMIDSGTEQQGYRNPRQFGQYQEAKGAPDPLANS
jgi:hypothetical protein